MISLPAEDALRNSIFVRREVLVRAAMFRFRHAGIADDQRHADVHGILCRSKLIAVRGTQCHENTCRSGKNEILFH